MKSIVPRFPSKPAFYTASVIIGQEAVYPVLLLYPEDVKENAQTPRKGLLRSSELRTLVRLSTLSPEIPKKVWGKRVQNST